MGMKKINYKKYLHRVNQFLWGLVFISLLTNCDTIVIEPEPVKTIEIVSGYSVQLTATYNGQWFSDNPSVATVSSTGLVTAVGAGKATIYTGSSTGEQRIVCYLEVNPKRNILFYIATDSDVAINADTPGKINYIRAGWQPDQGEMLIYADRRGQGALLLKINNTLTNGYYGLDTLEVYGTENSADAAVLSRMIDTLVNYPADSYGLIFFSHASGWLPAGTLSNPRSSETNPPNAARMNPNKSDPRSIVIDAGGDTRQEMEYGDFAAAIPDKRFDFIIFEACLMADVISMYGLRNKAEYVLASTAEIVSPGFSLIYKNEIMRLFDTKEPVDTVVSGFAQAYHDFIISAYPEYSDFCSSTLGLIKMSEMQNLATTVKTALNGAMIDESTLTVDEIQRFDRLTSINNGQYGYRFFDLDHVIENLASGPHYAAFRSQMEKTVVWKANTTRFLLANANGNPNYAKYDGFFVERHSGLSTYIEQDVFPVLNATYKNSSWYNSITN